MSQLSDIFGISLLFDQELYDFKFTPPSCFGRIFMFIFFDDFFYLPCPPPTTLPPHSTTSRSLPPLHVQTPVGVPMKGRGAGGAYTLLRGEGEGEQCVVGGGDYMCLVVIARTVLLFFPPSPFPSRLLSLSLSWFFLFILSYLCLGEWCAPESEEKFPGRFAAHSDWCCY